MVHLWVRTPMRLKDAYASIRGKTEGTSADISGVWVCARGIWLGTSQQPDYFAREVDEWMIDWEVNLMKVQTDSCGKTAVIFLSIFSTRRRISPQVSFATSNLNCCRVAGLAAGNPVVQKPAILRTGRWALSGSQRQTEETEKSFSDTNNWGKVINFEAEQWDSISEGKSWVFGPVFARYLPECHCKTCMPVLQWGTPHSLAQSEMNFLEGRHERGYRSIWGIQL